jgi:hypothetical protein
LRDSRLLPTLIASAALVVPLAAASPVDAPWGLTAVWMAGGVQLSWNAPVAPGGVDAYHVYRSGGNGTTYTLLAEVNGTAYLDPDGASGPHDYYVTAVHAGVESAPSNKVHGWPHCTLVTTFPVDVNLRPMDCLLPLPFAVTAFMYSDSIVYATPA